MGASCALRGQGEQLPGLHPSTRQGHLLPPMTVTATMSGCWRVSLGGNISLVVNHCSREIRTTPRGSGKIRPSIITEIAWSPHFWWAPAFLPASSRWSPDGAVDTWRVLLFWQRMGIRRTRPTRQPH